MALLEKGTKCKTRKNKYGREYRTEKENVKTGLRIRKRGWRKIMRGRWNKREERLLTRNREREEDANR